MLKTCFLLLLLTLSTTSIHEKDIFELDADEILASEIGDIYKVRSNLNRVNDGLMDTYRRGARMPGPLTNENAMSSNNIRKPIFNVTTTTARRIIATIAPEIKAKLLNTTIKTLKMRRIKYAIDKLLATETNAVADFQNNAYDPDILTREFDKIVANSRGKQPEDDARKTETRRWSWGVKKYIIDLMEHFIYETRYKLVYVQIIRKKYVNSSKYKIAFCFALLRNLLAMQKWVYYSLHRLRYYMISFFHLKMFEKIQNLEVEIKDMIRFITRLEYKKNIRYNPNFYEYEMKQEDGPPK